jgi:hypothetical protein
MINKLNKEGYIGNPRLIFSSLILFGLIYFLIVDSENLHGHNQDGKTHDNCIACLIHNSLASSIIPPTVVASSFFSILIRIFVKNEFHYDYSFSTLNLARAPPSV